MTRSIFDPTGPESLREGGTFSPPEARDISKMPPGLVDGVVEVDATDMVEFDAAGDEINGVRLDTRNLDPSDPDAPLMTQGGEILNPGHLAAEASNAPEADTAPPAAGVE